MSVRWSKIYAGQSVISIKLLLTKSFTFMLNNSTEWIKRALFFPSNETYFQLLRVSQLLSVQANHIHRTFIYVQLEWFWCISKMTTTTTKNPLKSQLNAICIPIWIIMAVIWWSCFASATFCLCHAMFQMETTNEPPYKHVIKYLHRVYIWFVFID